MTFKTPYRRRLSNNRLYWTNPDYRLSAVNYYRKAKGLPLLSSVDEIGRIRPERDEKGRFA